MTASRLRPEGRPCRAALRRAGRLSERDGGLAPIEGVPPQSPLDFAESVFRDSAPPMALRASMAKAALPYVHRRWCPIGSDPRDAKRKRPPPFVRPAADLSCAVPLRETIARDTAPAPLMTSARSLPARPLAPQREENEQSLSLGAPQPVPEHVPDIAWPDDALARRPRLQARTHRSVREAEEG